MRLAFLGYGEIGATVLGGLRAPHDVGLVVTHPSGFSDLEANTVPEIAEDRSIPLVLARNAGEPHVLDALAGLAPDVVVSANWRTTVPREALAHAGLHAINVHDALLPTYAGFGSVNWAIRNGETEIGLTLHVMEPTLDTGPVICGVPVPIGETDTATDVYKALLDVYPGAVRHALDLLAEGVEPVPQQGRGTFYHRIGVDDTRIDWTRPTTEVLDLVRAQSDPFVNSWFLSGPDRVFVKAARRPHRECRGTPGRVVGLAEGGAAVACGRSREPGSEGVILLEVQPEGGDPMPAADYFGRPGRQLH